MRFTLFPLLIFFSVAFPATAEAKINPDSLQQCAGNPALSDSNRVDALLRLSMHYKDNDLPRSLEFNNRALALADSSGNEFLIAKAKDQKGTLLKFKGEYKEAEELYLEAAKTFMKLNDSVYLSLTYAHLGSYYQAVEQNQLAIMYMLRSLSMDQKRTGTDNSIAATLNNIGNVYYSDKNFSKALEFYKNALVINQRTGNEKYIAINYLNIGNAFKELKNIDSASWYYSNSVRLSVEEDIVWITAAAHEGLGSCLLKKGKPAEARQEFLLGLDAAKKFGNKELELYLEAGLAGALKDLGQLDSAKIKWQYCMDTAARYDFSYFKAELYLLGAEIFEASGDLSQANKMYKIYSELKDSMSFKQNALMYRNFEERLREEELQHEQELIRKAGEEQARQENRRNKMALLFIGVVLLLSIGLGLFAYRSYRLKKKSHEDISQQKNIIEEKNREILSSISYAQRLQQAILPSQKNWGQQFPESFILYAPKDIVAGDFYWMEHAGDHVLFAVADCTGHGVPGALVSVVCSNALNRAVHEFGLTSPGSILDKVALLVVETFEKSGSNVYDGMDISLCAYNRKTNALQWTGANLPIWIVSHADGAPVLKEIKPDKQPIGKFDLRKPFQTHDISLAPGDIIYLFSDGYADQFGGPNGKKFKYKPLQQLLLSNSGKTVHEQRDLLMTTLENWRGELEQVDDVCVIGIIPAVQNTHPA